MKKAEKILQSIRNNYLKALRANDRASTLSYRGQTTRALAERDKANAYVTAAYDAEDALLKIIQN